MPRNKIQKTKEPPTNRLDKRGYTLIEVVVSLFVISVVILIYTVASNTVILNRDAKYRQTANRISVSLMEDLRNAPFAAMPASGPLTHPLLSALPAGSVMLTITDVTADLKQVNVVVSWTEPGNPAAKEATLTTYIGRHGL